VENDPAFCFFCGSDDLLVPEVGIAFGMGGEDYSFCRPCLVGMNAEEFWKKICEEAGVLWPPKLLDGP
jgi:hypothetical protein